ncbi:Holliday junction resolvase RuvX [Patescibacteria group bacterium]|nr:Holliday junction resolvase RuvX [Patescibacteria group bacterium]
MNKRNTSAKTYIGIDYGETNIGIALGRNELVQPLNIIPGKNSIFAAQEITRIGMQNKVDLYVLGLPVTHDGKDTNQAKKVRKFANLLKAISKKPVEFQEELDSSREALEASIELEISQKRGQHKDHLAAGIILRRYFKSLEK